MFNPNLSTAADKRKAPARASGIAPGQHESCLKRYEVRRIGICPFEHRSWSSFRFRVMFSVIIDSSTAHPSRQFEQIRDLSEQPWPRSLKSARDHPAVRTGLRPTPARQTSRSPLSAMGRALQAAAASMRSVGRVRLGLLSHARWSIWGRCRKRGASVRLPRLSVSAGEGTGRPTRDVEPLPAPNPTTRRGDASPASYGQVPSKVNHVTEVTPRNT